MTPSSDSISATIRPATRADEDAIWAIFHAVVVPGDTYVFDPRMIRDEARRLGFRGMQFNFVVSTKYAAVRVWQALGFEIVGTLPGAFRHAQRGFVDAYVMFRTLE